MIGPHTVHHQLWHMCLGYLRVNIIELCNIIMWNACTRKLTYKMVMDLCCEEIRTQNLNLFIQNFNMWIGYHTTLFSYVNALVSGCMQR